MSTEHKNHEIKGNGFILRVVRAQEADVIVRLLTSKGEKISAFAKAGLKSRKRFGGALEPLNYISFRATRKSETQELYYLEETQVKTEFLEVKTTIDRLSAATYVTELVEHGTREGLEQIEIFNLFGATLKTLAANEEWEGTVRQFEIKLLSLLGWLPGFQKCESCGRSAPLLTLNPESGHVTCSDCGNYSIPVTSEAQKILKQCLETSISAGKIDVNSAQSLERITAALFKPHWGPKPMKSAQFLSSLRNFQPRR